MQVIAGHSEGKQGVAGHSVQQQSISSAPAAISLPREVRLERIKGKLSENRTRGGGVTLIALPSPYPRIVSDGKIQMSILILRRGPCLGTISSDFNVRFINKFQQYNTQSILSLK